MALPLYVNEHTLAVGESRAHPTGKVNSTLSPAIRGFVKGLTVRVRVPEAPAVVNCGTSVFVVAPSAATEIAGKVAEDVVSRNVSILLTEVKVWIWTLLVAASTLLGVMMFEHVMTVFWEPLLTGEPTVISTSCPEAPELVMATKAPSYATVHAVVPPEFTVQPAGKEYLILSPLTKLFVNGLIVRTKLPVAPAAVYCGINVLVVAPRAAAVIAEITAADVMSRNTPKAVVVVMMIAEYCAVTRVGVKILEHVTTVSTAVFGTASPTTITIS